jgi:hypothetical protein
MLGQHRAAPLGLRVGVLSERRAEQEQRQSNDHDGGSAHQRPTHTVLPLPSTHVSLWYWASSALFVLSASARRVGDLAMEFALMVKRLWRLRLPVALGVLLAALLAVASTYHVDFASRTIEPRSGVFGAARTIVYVDAARPTLATGESEFAALTSRAQILARLLDSGEIKAAAARELGREASDITVEGPTSDAPGQQNVQPAAQQRANRILGGGSQYSVFVDTESNVPTITIFTQAPNRDEAVRLASALVSSLQQWLARQTRQARSGELARVRDEIRTIEGRQERQLSAAEERRERRTVLDKGTRLRTLGAPVGGDVEDQTSKGVLVLVFAAAVAVWCIALLLLSGVIAAIRRKD